MPSKLVRVARIIQPVNRESKSWDALVGEGVVMVENKGTSKALDTSATGGEGGREGGRRGGFA